MKKISSLFLALLALMGCFVGCDDIDYIGELRVLEDLAIDSLGDCTDQVIIFQKDGKAYLANRNGNVLTEGYDSMECSDPASFVVAYKMRSEIVDTEDAEGEEDTDSGDVKTERNIYDFDVLDPTGKAIFSRRYEEVMTMKESGVTGGYTLTSFNTVDGEYVVSCSESRIITYTERSYRSDDDGSFSSDTRTVKIYDLDGNCLASIENVKDVGTYLNGELLLLMQDSCQVAVADKNGKVIRTGFDDSLLISDVGFIGGLYAKCFVNGYVMLYGNVNGESGLLLVSEDFAKYYMVDYNAMNFGQWQNSGTLVVSRIMSNGTLSKEYYLIDLAKCQTDADGYCIPTLDAAVSKETVEYIGISSLFGKTEKYAVVRHNRIIQFGGLFSYGSSSSPQFGYLSVDGGHYKGQFDFAADFFDGISIVIKNGKTFVIDEEFNQISQSLTGYSVVDTCGGGVFCLHTEDGKYFAAVYD